MYHSADLSTAYQTKLSEKCNSVHVPESDDKKKLPKNFKYYECLCRACNGIYVGINQ